MIKQWKGTLQISGCWIIVKKGVELYCLTGVRFVGTSNCSWTSCKEGCTKDLYDCTQIRVNYKLPVNASDPALEEGGTGGGVEGDENVGHIKYERSLREYDYIEDLDDFDDEEDDLNLPKPFPTGRILHPR